ncbi:hypothetical protein HQ585_13790 [candidate division KSB1 bacterium]|nr:hypothetical protein [candidate division KSB1 bacterium]
MSTHSQKDDCTKVQDLILQTTEQNWTDTDKRCIAEHLKECASCQYLLQSISVFEQELDPETHPETKPLPHIRVNAIRHMKRKKNCTGNAGILQRLFGWKVPAYQAAVAFFILFVSISIINAHKGVVRTEGISASKWISYRQQSRDYEATTPEYADSSQIGRNVLEDSLLFRSLMQSDYRHEIQKIDSVLASGV